VEHQTLREGRRKHEGRTTSNTGPAEAVEAVDLVMESDEWTPLLPTG
jgi:hypothetical protein